jgi:hypothetical protein
MFKEYYLINGKFIPYISGGKGGGGGKGCFAAGTLIETPNGKKPIESILPGEQVLSFDYNGDLTTQVVTHIFYHPQQEVIRITLWDNTTVVVTDNHWFLTENNTFKEAKHFTVEEAFIGFSNQRLIIKKIEKSYGIVDTYNLTVQNTHTYIANGIYVHNKGGGKGGGGGGGGGGSEADDTLFSTDLLFVLSALGEGPIYRVNPNGPQDIEINEGPIDDLLNIDGDGLINASLFYYTYTTGTVTQAPLKTFGDSVISPQSLSNPVTLKNGNRPGVTAQSINYMSTSVGTAWDQLNFKFNITSLATMDNNGNIYGSSLSVTVDVYDSTGGTLISSTPVTISGKASSAYKFDVDVIIPDNFKSTSGYKFSIHKTSADSTTSKSQDSVTFYGWDEIQYGERAYPRTALVGYVISATSEYKGSIPTVTSMVKGLLCRVPSNYNQPILENGDIDWRQVEISGGTLTSTGYQQQFTGSTVLYTANPIIYKGLWDGSFVYNWTQNPVWILYELLTNKTWGLGIPQNNIDKYNFYKVAQYCDAVESKTGAFIGVDATADGTYRYKPRNSYTSVREILLGLPNGTAVSERRFIFDAVLSSKKQILDTINQITASFRGMLFYTAGKLSLNVDMPDELPMAIFNETNIIEGSLMLSGTKESDIITAVEVSFVDPLNHYKREVIRISDDALLQEVNLVENIKQIDLTGCTRRSQATRFGQYLLASGKYLRRKVEFKSSLEAIHLTIGDVISVSTKVTGTEWGHAGRVFTDTSVSNAQVWLEHFTSPGISSSIFTANSNPLALRILKQNSDRIDYYLLSNTNYSLNNTGNTVSGYDLVKVNVLSKYNPTTRSFEAGPYTFQANTAPSRHDLWTLGEVDPNNIFTSQSDKLFKITQLDRNEDHEIVVHGVEYISNVYVDSETQISYTPIQYRDLSSVLVAPPTPLLSLVSRPIRNPDGSITYAVDINSTTDTTGYPNTVKTQFEISYPDEMEDITGAY